MQIGMSWGRKVGEEGLGDLFVDHAAREEKETTVVFLLQSLGCQDTGRI